MPIGSQLVSMRHAEEGAFLERPAHQLHANRQMLAVETDREGQTGHARQVGRQGEDVFQVHSQRVISVAADFESCGGGNRRRHNIHFFKSLVDNRLLSACVLFAPDRNKHRNNRLRARKCPA